MVLSIVHNLQLWMDPIETAHFGNTGKEAQALGGKFF